MTAKLKCAVYTRKSSENGLEQAFNSLDAQRESAEAYIKSQRHEGWVLIKDKYDDGGFSGGNTERPALTRLLDDITSGRVNVVVVYKVDRLTRSLSDFAKLVDLFDGHGVSFVSVTQQFNTTTSMGRLTLNVLLSFAQFEREVTGERIRDKFAASRKKGMWMGGHPPLGYDIVERKLIVNEGEAKAVGHIFTRYLELGGVKALKEDLEREGYRSKQWTSSSNRTHGGKPFKRGALHYILKNRLYTGDAVHKGIAYPGEHRPIIAPDTWEHVQASLKEKAAHHEKGITHKEPSLLRGLLFDDRGNHMSPSHANKKGKRYRYYVSQALNQHREQDKGSVTRLPAHDLEQQVVGVLCRAVTNPTGILSHVTDLALKDKLAHGLELAGAGLAGALAGHTDAKARDLFRAIVNRVELGVSGFAVQLSATALDAVLECRPWENVSDNASIEAPAFEPEDSTIVTLNADASVRRCDREKRVLVPDHLAGKAPAPNAKLIKLVAHAHAWLDAVTSGRVASINELSGQLKRSRTYISPVIRVAFLAPDITESILAGTQPVDLKSADLLNNLPLDWPDQRRVLGFDAP